MQTSATVTTSTDEEQSGTRWVPISNYRMADNVRKCNLLTSDDEVTGDSVGGRLRIGEMEYECSVDAKRKVSWKNRTTWFELRIGPGAVQVERCTDGPEGQMRGGDCDEWGEQLGLEVDGDNVLRPEKLRGEIREWSRASRARMLLQMGMVDWEASAPAGTVPEFVTLTYPGDWPLDGDVVRAHLQAFKERYARRWGEAEVSWVEVWDPEKGKMRKVKRTRYRCVGAWKREYQRRGAPHFHLLLYRPAVIDGGWRAWQKWISGAWFEVVGSGDERHRRAGVRVDREVSARANTARRVAWYFFKHAAPGGSGTKEYQHKVPPLATNVGRWWGLWGVKREPRIVELGQAEAVEVARWLRRMARRRGWSVGQAWSLAWDGPALGDRLIAGLLGPTRWADTVTGEVRSWPPGRVRPVP